MQYMTPTIRTREIREDGSVVSICVWLHEKPPAGGTHPYTYELYFGRGGECLVRYDKRLGRGDHRVVRGVEEPYPFESLVKLLDDFQRDMELWE
jgi:hypothetical protein